ncbi:40S ribosomal protein S2-like [Macaca thibetana thibetana]|uniref:40S ribosomal protein S2-like n=1 Tax=Macaca thibetana thibetana TaxID=257877 RepID=UPI0021BCD4D4|nr:40S ribosomal protein S2-like [Macaca thibetana thibetana]
MADDAGAAGGPGGPGGPGMGNRGGFPGGFGSGILGRGRGRGRGRSRGLGRGRGAHGGKGEDKEWMPATKRGRLVKGMKIKSLEEIYVFSLPIKESEIIDFSLGASLKDEALKKVQKQTSAGQRTRFKAFVAIRDYNGHVGLGVKCSKEVATAIRGVVILAKLSTVPVRRGYWGNKIGKPHTVPCKVTGRCGSVLLRLIPVPRSTGIIPAPVPKKLLMMAGNHDCYTSARGCTATLCNFAKATFDAISKTYSYLTPDLWKETVFTKSPCQEFTDHLVKTHTRVSVQRTQAPAVATTYGFYTRKIK